MLIEVFGTACPQCKRLASAVRQAADKLGIHWDMCSITNPDDIEARGVVATPALAVNGEVKAVGKVPTQEELASIFASVLCHS